MVSASDAPPWFYRDGTSMRLHPLLLSVLLFTVGTLASSGDRSNEFQRCLQQCARQSCTADGHPVRALPLALRLTLWTCTDDCKYTCMHTLTDLAAESGVRAQQYYGKWPFWRYAGMQEPAAVAFSLANLLMHVLGADWLRRGVHPTHPMRPFYITWAYVSVNAWVWSAVFHTRGALFSLPHLFSFRVRFLTFSSAVRLTPSAPTLFSRPFLPFSQDYRFIYPSDVARRVLSD